MRYLVVSIIRVRMGLKNPCLVASLQQLLIGKQKCNNADDELDNDDDGDIIPMCRPCFAGDTKSNKILACTPVKSPNTPPTLVPTFY